MTHIVRGSDGYVLPICDQPWFDGGRAPKELMLAWERANREDWVRFDTWMRQGSEAEAKPAAKARTLFATALVLIFILAVVFR